MRRGKPYSQKFKFQALKMAKEIGVKRAARELKMSDRTLQRWIHELYDECEQIHQNPSADFYIINAQGKKEATTRERALKLARDTFRNMPAKQSDITKTAFANWQLRGISFPTEMLKENKQISKEAEIHNPDIKARQEIVNFVYDSTLIHILTDIRICESKGMDCQMYIQIVRRILDEMSNDTQFGWREL